TNDVCCTNLRNLPEHQLPKEVEEEEGVCGSRRVLGRETKGSCRTAEKTVSPEKPTKRRFVLINGSKQRRKNKCAHREMREEKASFTKNIKIKYFIVVEAMGERRNVVKTSLNYGFSAVQAVTRKCKFQIAFIQPAGNAPQRKDAIQFSTNWDVLQMKLKYSSSCLTSTLKRTQIQSRNITEVFKYRSYIQGLITENLAIMTSKKLQRKVHIKSSSENRVYTQIDF
ncbi:hypothetical protein ALC62_03542, partial [Cyphomyrmex costatus]